MKFNPFKMLILSLGLSASAISQAETFNVSPAENVTPAELATIYIFSEICPQLIGESKAFSKGYEKIVVQHLPKEKDPVGSLNKLAKQDHFQNDLTQARAQTLSFGEEKNKQVCESLSAYGNQN